MSALIFIYALVKLMIVGAKYHFCDQPLDYRTQRRVLSTYEVLSEEERQTYGAQLTDVERKALAHFPDYNKAAKLMAIAVSALIGTIAISGIAIHFVER